MRVRGSDEGLAGMKELLYVSKSSWLIREVIGSGREILEKVDPEVTLIWFLRPDLISFNY